MGTLRICEAGTVTTILSKHTTCIHHVYVHENACTQEDQFIFELLLRIPEDFHILWPKRLRAESTHPENWPKRPTYQGRNDPPPKLAETTQAETTQAETTHGRIDPDSARPNEAIVGIWHNGIAGHGDSGARDLVPETLPKLKTFVRIKHF